MLDATPYLATAAAVPVGQMVGRVARVVGLTIEGRGIGAPIGDLVAIERAGMSELPAEVVGFKEGAALMMPLGDADGLVPGARVRPLHRKVSVGAGRQLLGRVLDALGQPLDGLGPVGPTVEVPLLREAPSPMERRPIDAALQTGVSVIDAFLTIGRGQRVGIFAGSGVGKSTLLGDISRESLSDVNVIALIGERGREVGDFIHDVLGVEGMKRSIVVVATSDSPPLLRIKAAYTAVALAEWFRDAGKDVMLMLDSVTRFAAACREVGLALGEPPTVKGYPPSFFGMIPRLVERLGRGKTGSITGLFTVLVDGDDMNDPVADTLRGLLDGHIVLSRAIARQRFPAVDVAGSVSRIMDRVVAPEHADAARSVRRVLATFEDAKDLISVGAYKAGADARIDRAVKLMPDVDGLLTQRTGHGRPFADTIGRLRDIAARAEGA